MVSDTILTIHSGKLWSLYFVERNGQTRKECFWMEEIVNKLSYFQWHSKMVIWFFVVARNFSDKNKRKNPTGWPLTLAKAFGKNSVMAALC